MTSPSPANAASSLPAESLDSGLFDLSPSPLWLEDWSAIRELLRSLRPENGAAVRELLLADAERTRACARLMRIIRVNRATLELYEAADQRGIVDNLDTIFSGDFLSALPAELGSVWDDGFCASRGVNYTLAGRRLDISLKVRLMPGHEEDWAQVLVSTEDVTALEDARRLNAVNERYAQGLFEHSPVSLWVEDFSAIKTLLDELRDRGIKDFRVFTEVHPEFVMRCLGEIRIIDVNKYTISMFGAQDKADLLSRTDAIFRDEMRLSFRETLIDLWNGKLFQQREVINHTLDGSALYLHFQFSVLPGAEADWSRAQVALIDITARKRAETYLEYLGQHDTLTKLKNRNFYVEELQRIGRRMHLAASVVVIDVNGLKMINDVFGHAAGDDLLRRVGEVLAKAAQKPNVAARIGGDEFVVLMPGAGAVEGDAMISNVRALVGLNNQFYQGRALSLSIGRATTGRGEHIEDVVRRADERMYEDKQSHKASHEEREAS